MESVPMHASRASGVLTSITNTMSEDLIAPRLRP